MFQGLILFVKTSQMTCLNKKSCSNKRSTQWLSFIFISASEKERSEHSQEGEEEEKDQEKFEGN